jgi:hypothetical protein
MSFLRTAGALAACLAAGAGAAQTPPPTPKLRQICAADFQKLCPNVTPGHGALAQCVRGHVQELSSDCKSALMARREAMRARKAAMPVASAERDGQIEERPNT